MMEARQRIITYQTIELTEEEVKDLTVRYIREVILGNNCGVNAEGRLEYSGRRSGIVFDKGEATELQMAAEIFLTLLLKSNSTNK